MWRGGFGMCLKRLCCRNPIRCEKYCDRPTECAYGLVFETPNEEHLIHEQIKDAPRPYAIYPITQGPRLVEPDETLEVEWTLWGKAIELYPLLFLSWQELGRVGVTRDDVPVTLERVISQENILFQYPSQELVSPTPCNFNIHDTEGVQDVTIQTHTPIRVKAGERLAGKSFLSPEQVSQAFFYSLFRRISSLFPGDSIKQFIDLCFPAIPSIQVNECNLEWVDFARYSHRQKELLKLGGVQGSIHWSSVPMNIVQLIQLGSIFHIGKGTTNGLGKYQVIEVTKNL